MANANYERVTGVELVYWDGENEAAEPDEVRHARIEEMHEANGELRITFEARDDPDDYWSLTIPIKAKDSWNEFVDSLPTWVDQ